MLSRLARLLQTLANGLTVTHSISKQKIMNMHLPEYFLGDITATVAFGILTILLVVMGYKVFDKLTPKLPFDETLKSGNVAVAIVIGSFILGICHVIASVVSAILGA